LGRDGAQKHIGRVGGQRSEFDDRDGGHGGAQRFTPFGSRERPDRDRRVEDVVDEPSERAERRRVEPLRVVEHEHHRPRRCEPEKGHLERGVRTIDARDGIALACVARVEPRGDGRVDHLGECVAQRVERTVAPRDLAACDQDRRVLEPVCHERGRFETQACLSDTG
jgi:hypothetical protein